MPRARVEIKPEARWPHPGSFPYLSGMPFLQRPQRKDDPAVRKYGPALSLGTNMAAGVIGCTLLGVWLDRRLGTGERFTIAGLLLGMIYGGYEVWKVVSTLQKAIEDEEKKTPEPTEKPRKPGPEGNEDADDSIR